MIFVSKEEEGSEKQDEDEEEQEALLKSLVLFLFLPTAFVFAAFVKDDDVDEPSE